MLPWSSAAQEEPESIVLEVPEAEPEALDVLDDQVRSFGGGVGERGGGPAEDRDFPAGGGAREPLELGHVAAGAVVVEDDELPTGLEGVAGEIGLSQQFLGQVGGPDLAAGVARMKPSEYPGEGGRVEAVVAGPGNGGGSGKGVA